MKDWALNLLVCPKDKGELELKVDEEDQNGIKVGLLECCVCQKKIPIKDYVPRFVDGDAYARSFSLQWNKFIKTQLDSETKTTFSEDMFFRKTGFEKEEHKDKIVLDVGCGVGRFSEIVLKYGGKIISIDLSYSVYVAQKNFRNNPNITFIQADIFGLPFKEQIFEYIFSIGVLHHTPNCEKAFKLLPKFLKPKGKIAVWVYPKTMPTAYWDFIRIFTKHIPKRLLFYLSYLAIPLYYFYKIPVIGKILAILIPGAGRKKWRQRVLNTFDFYSPKYVSWHTYPQVFKWFEDSNLKNIRVLDYPVAMQGQKGD